MRLCDGRESGGNTDGAHGKSSKVRGDQRVHTPITRHAQRRTRVQGMAWNNRIKERNCAGASRSRGSTMKTGGGGGMYTSGNPTSPARFPIPTGSAFDIVAGDSCGDGIWRMETSLRRDGGGGSGCAGR